MTKEQVKYWNHTNIAGYITLAMFFIADRFLKAIALKFELNEYKEIIGEIIGLRLSFNPGIAFSLKLGGSWLTLIILFIILYLIIYNIYLILNKKGNKTSILPLTFIIFGAISNILDRIIYGAVIDYIDIANLTVLNISDVMITLGVAYLFISTKTNHAEKTARNEAD